MRAHDLNRARRIGKQHGRDPHASEYTPSAFNQQPLRRRYWEARDKAESAGTIFVWNEHQVRPARLYAAANMPRAVVVVSADPTISTNTKRNIVRYHHA